MKPLISTLVAVMACAMLALPRLATAQAPTGTSPYAGRIEHVVSGQVARFQSLEELLGFMIHVLTDV